MTIVLGEQMEIKHVFPMWSGTSLAGRNAQYGLGERPILRRGRAGADPMGREYSNPKKSTKHFNAPMKRITTLAHVTS